jgi:hypothetical protein
MSDMKIVFKKCGNYWGMNHYAAKQLGLKDVPPKDTLYLDPKYKGKENTIAFKRIVGHEKFEIHNLRDRHMDYREQESYTNKFERQMNRLMREN